MISPKDHPNASMVVIVGFIATELVDIGAQLGVTLTTSQSVAAATTLIGFVIFLGKKYSSKQEG